MYLSTSSTAEAPVETISMVDSRASNMSRKWTTIRAVSTGLGRGSRLILASSVVASVPSEPTRIRDRLKGVPFTNSSRL